VIIPLRVPLLRESPQGLIHFLQSLQGDPVDPMVADPKWMP